MKEPRKTNDFYETPPGLTRCLLDIVYINGKILEPCAGKGAITKVLKEKTHSFVIENDINPEFKTEYRFDATKSSEYPEYLGIDWIITNPPFCQAHEIISTAWEKCNKGIAMLLKVTYSEPTQKRGQWLQKHRKHETHRITFSPRPQFIPGGGSDSTTVAWFVWQKNRYSHIGCEIHYIMDWRTQNEPFTISQGKQNDGEQSLIVRL